MFIRIQNTLADNAPKTNSSAAIQSGATSVPVKNINDFTANYFTQVGQTGQERSEIVQVSGTPSGNSLTVGSTRFPHPTDTPLFAIKYNQIIVKRSTSGTSGTATNFGTVTITPDQEFTQFEDTTSTSGYAYKTAYYNSVLDVYSADSNWITTDGYSRYTRAGLRKSVRGKIKNIPGVEDEDINGWLDDYMEMLRSAAVQVNQDYGLGTLNITVGPGTQEYSVTDGLYRSPVRVWMIGSGTVSYTPIPVSEIDPTKEYVWDPRFYMPGDDVIGLLPIPTEAGTLQIIQNQLDAPLDSDDDEIPRPMKSYRTGFIDYCVAQAYYQDGKDVLGREKERMSMDKIGLFKTEISPRQRVQSEQVNAVMDTDFINDFSQWGF